MDDLLKRLAAPFPPATVSWRIGAMTADKIRGMALPYIDARDVQDRLDEVCGIYWQTRHHHCGGEKLGCDIGIKVDDEWVWRGDGAGATDVEAEKGSFSDSFKRAAVRWGIGRYLYDIDSPWVEIEAKGKTHIIPSRVVVQLRARLSFKAAIYQAGQPPFKPPQPATAAQQLKLSTIRDQLMDRINRAISSDEIETLQEEYTEQLQLIDTAHAPTGVMLRRLIEMRTQELMGGHNEGS